MNEWIVAVSICTIYTHSPVFCAVSMESRPVKQKSCRDDVLLDICLCYVWHDVMPHLICVHVMCDCEIAYCMQACILVQFAFIYSLTCELFNVWHVFSVYVVVDVFQAALDSGTCERIYFTEVCNEFECDAFFPEFDRSLYLPTEWVSFLCLFFLTHSVLWYCCFQFSCEKGRYGSTSYQTVCRNKTY